MTVQDNIVKFLVRFCFREGLYLKLKQSLDKDQGYSENDGILFKYFHTFYNLLLEISPMMQNAESEYMNYDGVKKVYG